MAKETKTNAMRMLDAAGIDWKLHTYDASDGHIDGAAVARKCGEDPEQVFKTLVLRGDKTKEFVCVIPGDMEVDLKVAAKISGNKNCEMLHVKDLLPTTGYIRGGCSPIGMKKPFPSFIHESALLYDYIYISAGKRGLQIKINPQALIDFVKMGIYPL